MALNTSDQPSKTLLALYRAKHNTPVAALARDLQATSRNYVYHLLDPTDPRYIKHKPSDELLRRLARRLSVSLQRVREDLARFEATTDEAAKAS